MKLELKPLLTIVFGVTEGMNTSLVRFKSSTIWYPTANAFTALFAVLNKSSLADKIKANSMGKPSSAPDFAIAILT